jgi:orotate phosphoribosyltransferase-like protein
MNKPIKALTFLVLAVFVLLIPASCVPGDTASMVESLLKNTEGGEITFVTAEGETFTVTITKTGNAAAGNLTTSNTQNKTVKPVTATAKTATTTKPAASLSDYLPALNSIEDVFKALGVWEKAAELQKKGLSWAKIAGELGYNNDTMYARILETNKEKLYKAKELGLIDQATYEYKIKYYSEPALKYVTKIFTESTKTTAAASLSDYLPALNSIEDVFKALGVWEKAAELQKKGLSWAKIAGELGYNNDTMYARILELNEDKLSKAKERGFIDQAALDYKIKYYGEQALKWVDKIFAS